MLKEDAANPSGRRKMEMSSQMTVSTPGKREVFSMMIGFKGNRKLTFVCGQCTSELAERKPPVCCESVKPQMKLSAVDCESKNGRHNE